MGDTFRTIKDRPIWWQDRAGVMHACEGGDAHRGNVRLIWTLCQRDVPANAAFLPGSQDKAITCPTCRAAA